MGSGTVPMRPDEFRRVARVQAGREHVAFAEIAATLPTLVTLPPWWVVAEETDDGRAWVQHERGGARVSVIVSAARENDGRRWVHFSIARTDRIPTWEEFVRAKELFLGAETTALQVLAPRSKWVNIHARCLHLFVCLDGTPVPDFTGGSGSL